MKKTLIMALFAIVASMYLHAQETLLWESFGNVHGSDESPSALDQSQFDNPSGWAFTNAFAGSKGIIIKKGGSITLPAIPELIGNAAFFFDGGHWFDPENTEWDESFTPHTLSIVNGELSTTEYDTGSAMTSPCMYDVGPETRLTFTAAYDVKLSGIRVYYGQKQWWSNGKDARYSPEPGTFYEPLELTLGPGPKDCDPLPHYFAVYTTDGTKPTRHSPRFTAPIHIDKTTTVWVATVTDNGCFVEDYPQEYVIELVSPVPDVPANTFDVTVSVPGSLQQQLLSIDTDVIEGLTLHGQINGEDIAYLTKGTGLTGSLAYLNMKDVTFAYDDTEYRTVVSGSPAGMGTTYIYHYILSDENRDEGIGGSPTQQSFRCYRNDLSVAFCDMKKLQHVVLPDILTAVGPGMFSQCDNLVAVTGTENITEVGASAFYYCRELATFEFGPKLTRLNHSAFNNTNLRGPMDLSNITYIGDNAFDNTKITSVKFPPSMEYLGEGAFSSTLLKEVSLPNPPDTIKAATFYIDGLEKVVIGEGLKYLGKYAFGLEVKDVTLPESIEETEWGALPPRYEATLTPEDGIIYVGKSAYKCAEERSSFTVKHGTKSLTSGLFSWSGLENVTLPATVEVIGSQAFAGTKLKRTPDMPGVRRIGEEAFACCFDMTKAVLPESLEYLGYSVFRDCSALWNLEFNCVDLQAAGNVAENTVEKITVGPKVRRIPRGLYTGNSNITAIDLPASVDIIDEEAFFRCTNLRSLNIPGQIKSIGEMAFFECSSLSDLAPLDVEVVSESAFSRCENLESLWLSDRTEVIEDYAFSSCRKLKNVHWSVSLRKIGDSAFASCDALQLVSLPEGLEYVGNSAFAWCRSLKTLYIPSTLKFEADVDSYGCFGFNNDGMNATVTCMLSEPPSIDEYYWNYNDRIGLIKVPAAVFASYRSHPDWAHFADRIVKVECIEPVADDSSTSFGSGIDENTDLGDAVVGDVYLTLGEEDSYDAADGCIVLNSIMEEVYAECIGGLAPGASDIANRFNGLVVNVAAGKGTVSVDCRTIGDNLLTVKVGTADPQTYVKNEKGSVDVDYDVAEPTYIYIYGSNPEPRQSGVSGEGTSRSAGDNCIRIYSVGLSNVNSGIVDVEYENGKESPITGYFTIDGRKVNVPATPGIYIIKRASGSSEKVYIR